MRSRDVSAIILVHFLLAHNLCAQFNHKNQTAVISDGIVAENCAINSNDVRTNK